MKIDISVLNRQHFNAEEFINSNTAKMEGIDNKVYNPTVLANLNRTADKAEEIRYLLNKPVKISSGYRCLQLNRLLNSKDTSQHIKGQAIDFYSPSFGKPKEIIHFLKEKGVIVDQMLMEGSWIHCSIREYGNNRNEFAYYLKDEHGLRKKVII
jgi:hypothetical protein